jgi:L-alanine-DL-glutamate epimerase-like enolase superfamily enzyme
MHIQQIACVPVDIPYKKTFGISGGQVVVQSNVLIKVTADDGHFGIGEATPLMAYSEETQGTVLHIIRDVLAPKWVGHDPRDKDLAWPVPEGPGFGVTLKPEYSAALEAEAERARRD